MKRAAISAINTIKLTDVPAPEPAPNEVKIAIAHCGICGSDIEEYQRAGKNTNCILGHEFSGEICAVGEGVPPERIGQRVAGHCYDSHGFSEYAVIPSDKAIPLPDSLSLVAGALLEPLAVVMTGLRHCDFRVGDTSFIFGCGTIGLLAIQALRACGSRKIIAANRGEFRRSKAIEFGADLVLDPSAVDLEEVVLQEAGDKIDFAIECTGIDKAILACSRVVRGGGTLCQLGLNAEPMGLSTFDLIVTGHSWEPGYKFYGITPFDSHMFTVSARLIDMGICNAMNIVTHRVPFVDIDKAFNIATDCKSGAIKVIVDM